MQFRLQAPGSRLQELLPWAQELTRHSGTVLCLPVVVERKAPLEYWRWTQGEALDRGIWDIPIPARRDVVTPDLILAPLVGFDQANYRLGYGGGYFDRFLRSYSGVSLGVIFQALLFDQLPCGEHDVPVQWIITEEGYYQPTNP